MTKTKMQNVGKYRGKSFADTSIDPQTGWPVTDADWKTRFETKKREAEAKRKCHAQRHVLFLQRSRKAVDDVKNAPTGLKDLPKSAPQIRVFVTKKAMLASTSPAAQEFANGNTDDVLRFDINSAITRSMNGTRKKFLFVGSQRLYNTLFDTIKETSNAD